MYLGAWRSTIEPQAMFLIWSEEGIPDLNAPAYINKDVEKLFNEAGGDAGTCDLDVRKEKYQEIQKIIAEESPYIFFGIENPGVVRTTALRASSRSFWALAGTRKIGIWKTSWNSLFVQVRYTSKVCRT